jgi:Flp pilus assembly pilin Flp
MKRRFDMNAIKKFWADETGLEMSEYAVAAAIVIVAAVAVWSQLGSAIAVKIDGLRQAVATGGGS